MPTILEEFLVKLTVQGPNSGQVRDAEAGLESLRLGIASLTAGVTAARPGLREALERAGEGDTLTVWRIDRLGRSTLHLLQILDQLRSRNIAFQSVMDGIDTNTAAGRMVFSMVGAIAEFERNVISERTKAGMAAARRRLNGHTGDDAPGAFDA